MGTYEELQTRAAKKGLETNISSGRNYDSGGYYKIYELMTRDGKTLGATSSLSGLEQLISKARRSYAMPDEPASKPVKKSASHKAAKRMLIRNGKPNMTAEKEWVRLSRAEQLQAYHETGSFVEPKGRTLQDIGGSTADVLFDWTKKHKKEYPDGY